MSTFQISLVPPPLEPQLPSLPIPSMTGNTKGSLIEEKFRNKTIFLTGATGFYGGNLVHLFMSLRIKALCCLADGAKRICGVPMIRVSLFSKET